MTLILGALITGTLITYNEKEEYLKGFSISYYITVAQNVFGTLAYRYEFANAQGKPFTASIFDSLGKVFTVSSINSEKTTKAIPVLVYHGITEESDNINISLEIFKEQMFALKKAGYETVNMEDFKAFMKNEKELPEKSFLLTFDDGRRDSFYNSDPVFKALDYNAVMFVITLESINEENSRSDYYLSKWELERTLKNDRWEIESHGRDAHRFYPIDESGTYDHFFNKLWLANENRLESEEEFQLWLRSYTIIS